MKICLVGSSGGHLMHLYLLEPIWQHEERFWVTFDKEDARSLLKEERWFPCYFPANRSLKALIKNTWLAIKLLLREKPDLIISSGAAVAVPFFYIGRLLGCKTVFIEVYDRVQLATLTGRLVYPVSDLFVVQWPELLTRYPKAVMLGGIFR